MCLQTGILCFKLLIVLETYELWASNIDGPTNFYESWASNIDWPANFYELLATKINQPANFYELWSANINGSANFMNFGLQKSLRKLLGIMGS